MEAGGQETRKMKDDHACDFSWFHGFLLYFSFPPCRRGFFDAKNKRDGPARNFTSLFPLVFPRREPALATPVIAHAELLPVMTEKNHAFSARHTAIILAFNFHPVNVRL